MNLFSATGASGGRLFFRFGLGIAVLARDRLGAALAAAAAGAAPRATAAPVEVSADERAIAPAPAALGLLLGAAARGARASAALRARWAEGTSRGRRLATPLRHARALLGRLPGAPRAAAALTAWQGRLIRWSTTGRREEAEGRALARGVITTLRETAFARVSESPDLQRVIHEQSAGVAVTAVDELRERSAHADNLAEGAVRRLFSRRSTARPR